MERTYIIPLRKAKEAPRTKRTPKAVKIVRAFLEKHMKSEDVSLDNSINEKLWERGIQKIPSKIKVKAVKDEYGSVVADHIPEYNQTQSISVFDEALDSYERDMAKNIFKKKPFGIGPIIGFMYKKEDEIKNLKIIARSKRGPVVPSSEIKEMLL